MGQEPTSLATTRHAPAAAIVMMVHHAAKSMTPGSNVAHMEVASHTLVAVAGRESFVTRTQHAPPAATVMMAHHAAKSMIPGSSAAPKEVASHTSVAVAGRASFVNTPPRSKRFFQGLTVKPI